jgi:hypothetical protein
MEAIVSSDRRRRMKGAALALSDRANNAAISKRVAKPL